MKKTTNVVVRIDIEREGFCVEIMPYMHDGEEWLEFMLCNEEYGFKDLMFCVRRKDCPEDVWEDCISDEIDDCIESYYETIESLDAADFECGDCCCDYGSEIYEAIDFHNEQIDAMQELGVGMLNEYEDIEDTSVNTLFCEAYQSHVSMAIWLCCMANAFDDNKWMTTEDWRVVCEDEEEE